MDKSLEKGQSEGATGGDVPQQKTPVSACSIDGTEKGVALKDDVQNKGIQNGVATAGDSGISTGNPSAKDSVTPADERRDTKHTDLAKKLAVIKREDDEEMKKRDGLTSEMLQAEGQTLNQAMSNEAESINAIKMQLDITKTQVDTMKAQLEQQQQLQAEVLTLQRAHTESVIALKTELDTMKAQLEQQQQLQAEVLTLRHAKSTHTESMNALKTELEAMKAQLEQQEQLQAEVLILRQAESTHAESINAVKMQLDAMEAQLEQQQQASNLQDQSDMRTVATQTMATYFPLALDDGHSSLMKDIDSVNDSYR